MPKLKVHPSSRHLRAVSPALIASILFVLALWLIHREVAHLELQTILKQLAVMHPASIALAIAATAGSYISLTGYDRLALVWIGQTFSYHRIAFASFTAYALAHNIGFNVLSGGAVRYKLYGSWGLDASQIARITGFVALTTALGMSTILGIAAFGEGHRLADIIALPTWYGSLGGLILLLIPFCWLTLASFKIGHLTWRSHTLAIPSLPVAVSQVVVSLIDNALAAMALYVLLPESVGFGPLGFMGLYVIANTIGLISHVPGGVGVFDAVILVAVPPEANAGTIAALLTYRIIYYLLPLVLAGVLLASRALRRTASRRVIASPFSLLPSIFATLVFASGLLLLVSGATPAIAERTRWLITFVPLGVIEVSHFSGSLVGVALLLLSDGLRRRLDGAWLLACGFLIAGILFSLLKGGDWEEALGLAITLGALMPCRQAFHRKTRLSAMMPSPGWLAASALSVCASVWLGYFAYRNVNYSNDLWWTFVLNGEAPRFLRASVGVVAVLAMVGLRALLRPAPATFSPADSIELSQAANIIESTAGCDSSAWLALLGDKRLLFSLSGESFIMFGIYRRSWIAFGEPTGQPAEHRDLVWRFVELCRDREVRPAFYQISPKVMPTLAEAGFAFQKVGEQAFVPLTQFDLHGSKRSKLRQAWNRGRRLGMAFEVIPKEQVIDVLDELQAVSNEWLLAKHAGEKGFSLGRFNADYIRCFPVAVLRREGRIIAFGNVWTTFDRSELSIDLMRHSHEAPNGVMDQLFIELMLWGKAEGYAEFDLGMAPMAGLESRSAAPLLSRAGALMFQHSEHFYNFKGLRAYKDKFDPVWRPRYLAAEPGIDMARALGDTALLISGGVRGLISK